jgi:phosphoglycolate phosphatase
LKYDIILFDLDGTLTNPFEGITKSVQYSLSCFGIEEPDLNSLKKFIGPSLADSFHQFYGFDIEKSLLAVEKYRERYGKTGVYENKEFDGMKTLLQTLLENGATLGVASLKPQKFVDIVLNHFDLSKFFKSAVGSEMFETSSDKTQVIQRAMDNLHASNDDSIIMIGDKHHDARGAKSVGIPFGGVLYGFGSQQELSAEPHVFLAKDVEDLKQNLIS